MKTPTLLFAWSVVLLLPGMALRSGAQTYTQSLTLLPGWNSVFLEVTPSDPTVASVFANSAIDSVWEARTRVSTVQFIQNQNEVVFNRAGWSVYVPTNQIESVNNDLYTVAANHSYLIKIHGTAAVTVRVSGRPSLKQQPFQPDAFTLRGFHVDPTHPPTFQAFFGSSPAHTDPATGLVRTIYRLNNASSQWQLVNPNDTLASGVAYWVYTVGASSFAGPLSASTVIGDGLDYGTISSQHILTLQNNRSGAATSTLTDLGAGPRPVAYYRFAPGDLNPAWLDLPQNQPFPLAAGATLNLHLAVRRGQMTGTNYTTVFQITDGQGTRVLVPVSASRPAAVASASGGIPVGLQTGLWVGDITLNAVAETRVNPTNPTPVKSTFDLRLLVHVDTNGVTRLLREVIQMFQPGTTTNNALGQAVVSQPGRYVLLTDDTLLPQFQGATVRDGVPVGRRFSTASFDFDPPGGTNYVTMTGSFGISNSVGCTLTLQPTTPTNPFLHLYHPDHDNLDGNYQPITVGTPEVFTIVRQIKLQFTASDPTGQTTDADYGYRSIGGNYSETVTGLHNNPLMCSGVFHLTKVIDTPMLNQ
jgi:hypothetical protein